MSFGGLSLLQNLPGIDAALETVENEFMYGPAAPFQVEGVILDSSAVDATGTPTTLLRRGLVMGQITATSKWADYDPTATDGTQFPLGFLYQNVNMYDIGAGAVREKVGRILKFGNVKTGSVYGFDEFARVALGGRFLWDDNRYPHLGGFFGPVAKTADYTVLTTDNGKAFTTTGGAGARVFTLPAIGSSIRGCRFRFHNTVDQNMTVTAPANKLVTFNNATATSVAFSTAGNKIGATVEIVADELGAKWIAIPSGANTMTVA